MEPSQKKTKMFNNKSNKKKKYFQIKKNVLQAGQRGFLATCNINEKSCIRECYNLLNHYADILYGPEGQDSPNKQSSEQNTTDNNNLNEKSEEKKQPASDNNEEEEEDDDDDLDAAVAKCREVQKKQRFQNVDTGTQNCIFIRTQLNDPVELGKHIVNDITVKRSNMCRFLLRLVPIEAVCRANVQDIVNAAGSIFDRHFLKEPTTYGIIFNRRYNQQVKREDVITQLADLVHSKNIGNKVDLHNAKKSIIVEIIRGFCLLSVIDNYLESKKFNLNELANPNEKKEKNPDESPEKSKAVDEKSEAVDEKSKAVDDATTTDQQQQHQLQTSNDVKNSE